MQSVSLLEANGAQYIALFLDELKVIFYGQGKRLIFLASLRLKQFRKFDSATVALEEASALVEGKVSPLLASLLDTVKDEKKASLAVADPKLGQSSCVTGVPTIHQSLTSIIPSV